MNERKMRNNRAITLIALVITIIILLILAGVSLRLISGDEGILERAESAVNKNQKAIEEEELNLAISDLKIAYYENYDTNKNMLLSEYIKNNLNNYKTPSGGTINCNEDGQIIYTDKNGNTKIVTITEDGNIVLGEESNVPYYSIIKKLAEGVSLSNSASRIKENEKYTTKIIAEVGYEIDNVIVKMENEEITLDELTEINIENVIGDIEIIVEAQKIIIDYWPLTSNLNNVVKNRDNMEVKKGEIAFSDGLYIDGDAVVETPTNYTFPDGDFSLCLDVKLSSVSSLSRSVWLLNVGTTGCDYNGCLGCGFHYDSHYPLIGGMCYTNTNGYYGYFIDSTKPWWKWDTWDSLALVCSGNRVTTYINGVSMGTPNYDMLNRDWSSPLGINRGNEGGNTKIKGYFRNIKVYGKALTEEELQ